MCSLCAGRTTLATFNNQRFHPCLVLSRQKLQHQSSILVTVIDTRCLFLPFLQKLRFIWPLSLKLCGYFKKSLIHKRNTKVVLLMGFLPSLVSLFSLPFHTFAILLVSRPVVRWDSVLSASLDVQSNQVESKLLTGLCKDGKVKV